jgi:hypothetical protein
MSTAIAKARFYSDVKTYGFDAEAVKIISLTRFCIALVHSIHLLSPAADRKTLHRAIVVAASSTR